MAETHPNPTDEGTAVSGTQYDHNDMITTQSREHVQMIIQVSMYIQMS